MVTKSDYGLGPLYHGTSKDSADAILVGGLLVMGGQPIWLSFSQQEALENAQEKEGLPVVLEVNLPDDWLLERAEAGTYHSWRDIPSEYIRLGGVNMQSDYKYGWYLIDKKANDAEYSFPEYTEDEALEKMRLAVESRYNVFYYDQPGWVATGTYHAPADFRPMSIDDIKPYITGFMVT